MVGKWQLKQVQLLSIRNVCGVDFKAALVLSSWFFHTTVSLQLKALGPTQKMSGNQYVKLEVSLQTGLSKLKDSCLLASSLYMLLFNITFMLHIFFTLTWVFFASRSWIQEVSIQPSCRMTREKYFPTQWANDWYWQVSKTPCRSCIKLELWLVFWLRFITFILLY